MPHRRGWTTGDTLRALVVLALVLIAWAMAWSKERPRALEAEPRREVVDVERDVVRTDSLTCVMSEAFGWICTTVVQR